MLEWEQVCKHLAEFASTACGKQACLNLQIPSSQQESERLLEQTRAAITLEQDYATSLGCGSVDSAGARQAVVRAEKGGVCSVPQLRAMASVLLGADQIKKQVLAAARTNNALSRTGPIGPLVAAVQEIRAGGAFVRAVHAATDADGNILDEASEKVRLARLRVRQAVGRVNAVLRRHGAEVVERGGRMYVALPQGSPQPQGSMVVGMDVRGGQVFVEPPAAMALNTDLQAARGEARAAEEEVLVGLTARLTLTLADAQACYQLVVWADVLAAKAGYGLALGGVIPSFVPWAWVSKARECRVGRQHPQRGATSAIADSSSRDIKDDGRGLGGGNVAGGGVGRGDLDHQENAWGKGGGKASRRGGRERAAEEETGPGGRYMVRLRGLRHPLLMGSYLKARQQLSQQLRAAGIDPATTAPASLGSRAAHPSSSSSSSSSRRSSGVRRLPEAGSKMPSDQAPASQSTGKEGGLLGEGGAELAEEAKAAYASLKPPVPVDVLIKPETCAVVITGPNTGGKTAVMKALGLVVCMARAGLPVPCNPPAALPAFSTVLADIGDEQSLSASLSTFSSHLTRIQALRAEADGRALILLDEVGTGTDPCEGAALGVALLRRLAGGGAGGGALTLATTHHSLLTGLKFEDEQGRFENASVAFDEATLTPTYHLLWGIPGRSNAINIASRLGLDSEVVEAARAHLDVSVAASDAAVRELEGAHAALSEEEEGVHAAGRAHARLERKVHVLRSSVRALQEALDAARTQALFEVWKAGTHGLAEMREAAQGVVGKPEHNKKKKKRKGRGVQYHAEGEELAASTPQGNSSGQGRGAWRLATGMPSWRLKLGREGRRVSVDEPVQPGVLVDDILDELAADAFGYEDRG